MFHTARWAGPLYNGVVTPLSWLEARECVLREVPVRAAAAQQKVTLAECVGRVLAAAVHADRDSPPHTRSVRDGFAVRAADLPGTFHIMGEVRAGEAGGQVVGEREAVEIMTGAALPSGADTVVMVEHALRNGTSMSTERTQPAGEFVSAQGGEFRQGDILLLPGKRLTFVDVALLAAVGVTRVAVTARPRVAIIATGDEVVPLDTAPLPHQVRNSNSHSVAAQVRLAGGEPDMLPIAPDRREETRTLIERGLEADLLLLSGGVSAGRYDLVEDVLAELGARFFFDRVRIQPGQPLVFGQVRGKFFFGLPGNPTSTMVTFRVFAQAALERLAGVAEPPLPITQATLEQPFRHRPGLTRFLPARLAPLGMTVAPVPWQGSSDMAALSRANAFLVVDADRESWEQGDLISVLTWP